MNGSLLAMLQWPEILGLATTLLVFVGIVYFVARLAARSGKKSAQSKDGLADK